MVRPMRVLFCLLLVFGVGCFESWSTESGLDSGAPARDVGPPDAPMDASTLGDGAFRLATWNLEQFPLTSSTVPSVARLVRELDLDVVGVQEIRDRETFETLASALDFEQIVSFGSDGFTRVGFLYDPERIRVSEIDRLFRDDDYAYPRDPIKAQLEVLRADGTVAFDFLFVVVHLKARTDLESQQRRVAAIERLEAWMTEQLEGPEQDIVVVGDFNDLLDDPPDSNVYGPLLEDDRFRFLTAAAVAEGDYTFPRFESFIDHILVTRDALDEYGEGVTAVSHLERTVPRYLVEVSDHLPVVATFALP